MADNIIARFRIANRTKDFELVETPKGLIEARIDGIPMTKSEREQLSDALEIAKDQEDE
jgi:hypothetical protein